MKFIDIPQLTQTPTWRVTYPWSQLLEKLADWQDGLGLQLDPDFQRAHVWDEARQVHYVEYVLRGGQGAREIYFNHPGWHRDYRGEFVLVDGKQRLEAVRRFLTDELEVFGHHRLSSFEDRLPWEPCVYLNVNNLPTRGAVLRWYLDLNEGGIVHTTEELDHVRRLFIEEGW